MEHKKAMLLLGNQAMLHIP